MRDFEEITVYLDKINKRIEKELIKAQRNTAKSIQQDAKDLAPGQGTYANTIEVRDTEKKNGVISTKITTDVTVTSKANGNEYNLGYLLENGTDPHLIRPVDAQALHFQIDGEDIFTKLVHHPGFTSMPHFYPALVNNEDKYCEEIEKVLDKEFK